MCPSGLEESSSTSRRQGRGSQGSEPLRVVEAKGDSVPAAHIVVGYDEDPQSQTALQTALELARRLDAHLDVVHVVDLRDYPVDPDREDWESESDKALERSAEHLRSLVQDHPQGWSYHAWRGDPVHLLAAVAEEREALMIVVGTHGPGFTATLHRVMGGSVSRGLVGHSHTPVLVVPPSRRH